MIDCQDRTENVPCDRTAPLYRQCPIRSCAKLIGFCTSHGGDTRASSEMEAHILADHKPAVPA